MELNELKRKIDETGYVYDDTLATVLAVALKLGRPLLIEGAAGVGKTEIAKVMPRSYGRRSTDRRLTFTTTVIPCR